MSAKQRSERGGRSDRHSRTVAEWVTLGVAVAILVLLVGGVLYQDYARGDQPATLVVTPLLDQVRQSDGRYYLPVTVENTGDNTAEELRVALSLGSGAQQESSEFSIQFLAGGATANAVVVFSSDPQQGQLKIDAISYLQP